MRTLTLMLLIAGSFSWGHTATATPISIPLFFIAKSENRNQVHYAVQVDQWCRPEGRHPVYGYWREFEIGPTAVSRILDHEQSAYGLNEPRITITPQGGQIRVSLRGFPSRPLTIQTFRRQGRCAARTLVMINKQPADLQSIYLDIGFLAVNSATIRGQRDDNPVQERIK